MGISSLEELSSLSLGFSARSPAPDLDPARPLAGPDLFSASSSEDWPLSLRFPASSLSFLLSFSSSLRPAGVPVCGERDGWSDGRRARMSKVLPGSG